MDPDLATIRSYGLLNESDPEVPHPTAVIVDREGIVRYVRVDEDFRVRPTPEELLEALQALAPGDGAPAAP